MKVFTVKSVKKRVAKLITKVSGEKAAVGRWSGKLSNPMGDPVPGFQKSLSLRAESSCESGSTPNSTAEGKNDGAQQEAKSGSKVALPSELPYAPRCRFYPGKAKQLIGEVLRQRLTGAVYDPELAPTLVKEITDDVKKGLKEMDLEKYKIVVQAVIGDQRGQGFQMSCRCFWDPNTDDYAHDSFVNESIFCVAGAFVLYLY